MVDLAASATLLAASEVATMGYVPGFSNDIFISYSHIDDQAIDAPGWVTDFHRRLAIEVEEELGARVRIWRDKRITGATDFSKDLDNQVRGSAVLLAILSPGYVNSRWCDWEFTGFAGSRRIGDLWVDSKCRAIKIVKRPTDVSRVRVLPDTEGIRFFDIDPSTDLAHEMPPSSSAFKHRLAELGHEIGLILRAMRKARTVFLGTASGSLHDRREGLRQQLSGREYRILSVVDDLHDSAESSVRAGVSASALSVLFHDRTAPADQAAEELATLERRVAIDQQARQIIVVCGQSGAGPQPWEEPDAAGRGSAGVEWLIDPPTHNLLRTVLVMLKAQPAAAAMSDADPHTADEVANQTATSAGGLEARGRITQATTTVGDARSTRAATRKQRRRRAGTASPAKRRLFLCYRRNDTGGIVGRMYDRLALEFGGENIFKDLDNIPFGVDFVEHLDREVRKCDAVFVVIGPRWLEAVPEGGSRLDDPNDFVRIEIASALRREIPVVPLLVDGAQMPRAEQLPEEIRALSRRNGTVIRHDPDFHNDITRLLSRLG